MTPQEERKLNSRKTIRIQLADKGGYIVRMDDYDTEHDEVSVFPDLDKALAHAKKHFAKLKEDIQIARLQE